MKMTPYREDMETAMKVEVARISEEVMVAANEDEDISTIVARGIRTWIDRNVKHLTSQQRIGVDSQTLLKDFTRYKQHIVRDAVKDLLQEAASLNDGIIEVQAFEKMTERVEIINVDLLAVSIKGFQEFMDRWRNLEPLDMEDGEYGDEYGADTADTADEDALFDVVS